MRKVIASILLLLAGAFNAPLAVSVFAQTSTTPFPVPIYYASAFGLWSLNGQAPNTYTFQGRSLCNSSGQNTPFFVFNTNATVWIADQTTANSEVVTPSAVVNTAGSCGVSVSPSNSHYTFQLKSGTGGLQEALNTVLSGGGTPALIALDRNWWTYANQVPGTSGATIIGAVKGGYGAILEDITTANPTFYVWTGTAYSSTAAYWQNTAPTLAAGAAAGSGPTVSNNATSTALSGVANVTSGTATTTGTLFTETFPSNSGTTGSFQNAGTCTVTSVGTNSFTAFTVATSFTSSHRLLTVTATGTPTVSTAYQFSYNCK